MLKAKLLALLAVIAGVLSFGYKKKMQGKTEQEAKQTEAVLDNVKMAKDSVNNLSDPDEYDRLREKYTKKR